VASPESLVQAMTLAVALAGRRAGRGR
jgi:hypothetical protein